ncbi:SPOR domain-containing protein [Marichromatium bheemlicum]|uniref:SPOR domain-containing protein n=1 Tax=Marichromatium bheemlicum TaxID=365339 RepID=A0ABX1I5W3_9GAMM|nr:SPOR domain-containing protein [Marichromatium bheemlicum]NKN32949.1 SPOR domain-containing protein [Marichromatium bheemlicum]
MTRDYRRGGATRPSPKRQQSRSCVWWFLLGALLGAFGASLYWMPEPETGATEPAPRASRSVPVQPDFQFPTLLRDAEIEVGTEAPPPPPVSRPRPEPQPPVASPPPSANVERAPAASSGSYVVQAGSFKRNADAEQLRAELGLLGLSSRIERVTLDSGAVYHRVRLGPYVNKAEADRVRDRLQRAGKEGLTLPVR